MQPANNTNTHLKSLGAEILSCVPRIYPAERLRALDMEAHCSLATY